MNRLLALCTSPDQGGLELYFLKFTRHYEKQKGFHVACSKNSYISKNIDKKIECETHGLLKTNILRNLKKHGKKANDLKDLINFILERKY